MEPWTDWIQQCRGWCDNNKGGLVSWDASRVFWCTAFCSATATQLRHSSLQTDIIMPRKPTQTFHNIITGKYGKLLENISCSKQHNAQILLLQQVNGINYQHHTNTTACTMHYRLLQHQLCLQSATADLTICRQVTCPKQNWQMAKWMGPLKMWGSNYKSTSFGLKRRSENCQTKNNE